MFMKLSAGSLGAHQIERSPAYIVVNYPANRLSIRMHELSHDGCRQGMAPMFLKQLEIDMNIVKSRGGMAAILATLALASVTAFAQAPGGGPPGAAVAAALVAPQPRRR